MHLKILILCVAIFVNRKELSAQNQSPLLINNGWELSFSPYLSFKENIKPNYPNTSDFNIYSKPTFGFDVNISRNFSWSDKTYLSIGGSLGSYKADIGYDLNKNLLDSNKLKSYDAYYYDKSGLSLNFSFSSKYYYSIFKTSRNECFAGIGINLNYLVPAFYSFGDNRSHLAMNGSFNNNQRPFLSGIVSLSFRHQISERFYFITGLSQNYSPSIVFKGNYEIYTQSNTASGNIEKQFSQTQINLGLFKSFTPKSYTSKKKKESKLDIDALDFYGKGWGISFTPYIVPKFSVVQNPISQTTFFYSKPRLSYKGELSKLTPLSTKAFLKTTLAYGGFKTDEGLKIEQSESISEKEIDIYEKYSEGMRYWVLSMQYNHVLFSNEYQALTLGLGVSVNKVVPAGWGDVRTAYDNQVGRTKIYYETEGDDYGAPDSRGRPFVSGVFDVSYWSKIDERFSFYISSFTEISDKSVLFGNYKIYGRKNMYDGMIHKKFHQYGLRLGVFYMLR